MNDDEVLVRINEFFDANYRQILAEGGAHVLTPRALDQARQQVEHYWKKLREIAVNVSETEVRLQLPNQTTPKGRKFVIEGVVDLVREAERIRMYDIKTHYCEEVLQHRQSYAAQLNVYAYIWRELRGQEVHEIGVIAIQLPDSLREAIRRDDKAAIARALVRWNPLVPIPFDSVSIRETFQKIARVVDQIEDGEFHSPPATSLGAVAGADENSGGESVRFATLHCRNCDGRFSCGSYREYMNSAGKAGRRFDVLTYMEKSEDDGELDDWIDGNIELDLDRLAE
jgi:PD-(D/E)XK nuclease superfamily